MSRSFRRLFYFVEDIQEYHGHLENGKAHSISTHSGGEVDLDLGKVVNILWMAP